jgi:Mg-chelatase subunit ChlD
LQRLVDGITRQPIRLKDYGRVVDRNRMHRLLGGDCKVFRHQKRVRRRTAAVHVLLDTSSSMYSQLRVAVESALTLGLALEQIPGVSLAISRFPVSSPPEYTDDVEPLLRRRERIAVNVPRFNVGSGGGTPLTDAMWYCLSELLMQKEERKVLLVVTDGEPNDRLTAKESAEFASRVGIEPIGVGIGTHSVNGLFDHYCVINDASELAQALFGVMQQTLSVA